MLVRGKAFRRGAHRECDCQDGDCKDLDDLKDYINDTVNDAVQKLIKAGADVVGGISEGFGKNRQGFGMSANAGIEDDIEKLPPNPNTQAPRTLPKKKADTKYKDAKAGPVGLGGDGHLWGLGDKLIAPCVKVSGKCIGLDKIGHFFQQGKEYFDKMQPNGNSDAAEKWSKKTESEMSGTQGTGVYSNADLEANRQGGQAYRDMKKGTGKKGGGDYKFDICKYVNDNWSEETNPNKCCDSLQKKIDKAKGK